MKGYWVFFFASAIMLAASGCAKHSMMPVSDEDNPAHHYLMGMQLIEKGHPEEADASFSRALQLDPKHPFSLAGKALAASMALKQLQDSEHRAVSLARSLELLDNARSEADSDSEKFSVQVTGIRVFTNALPKNWLDKAQDCYDDAKSLKQVKVAELPYYRSLESADFFMGLAAYKALQFRDAEDLLSKVMQAPPGRWHEPAALLFKKVHKVVRAAANYTLTDVAKKIAIKDQVVRADVAALLVDDLRLERLMAGRIPLPKKEGEAAFVPSDVTANLFKSEIMIVMKCGLRGLEPRYDQTSRSYLFNPDGPIMRKELAFIIEDLLVKITGDEGIPTTYFGQKRSPYPDVPPSSPWYNAVMNAASRNLMETELSGAFRPDEVADGAELLLAVVRLREAMNIY